MNGITDGIREFYRQRFAHTTIPRDESTGVMHCKAKIFPVTRLRFGTGATLAIALLIQKIVTSIFYLLCNLATIGLSQSLRSSLSKNVREGLSYAGAIPVGYIGMLFPQTINQQVLRIPDEGLLVDVNQLDNPLIAGIKRENLISSPTLPTIVICDEVKLVLNKMFEGSVFSVDTLPVYSFPLNDKKPSTAFMPSPVMKGITTDDRRPFIAIKLYHILTDQEIDEIDFESKDWLRDNRENQWLITLYQRFPDDVRAIGEHNARYLWSAIPSGPFISPAFFSGNITFSNTGELVEGQQRAGFELLKTVLKTGQGLDLKGSEWRLVRQTPFNNIS
ncbi:MAG: hypothetical protein ACHQUC_00840 [Chlamydiales bacterium]